MKKILNQRAHQNISGIVFLLIGGLTVLDIMTFHLVYGNLLGATRNGIIIECVIAFVIWLLLTILSRSMTNMESAGEAYRQYKEGGGSAGLLEKAKAKPMKESTTWLYRSIAMLIIAGVFGGIVYGVYSDTQKIPVKMSILAIAGAVGFAVSLVVSFIKKAAGK